MATKKNPPERRDIDEEKRLREQVIVIGEKLIAITDKLETDRHDIRDRLEDIKKTISQQDVDYTSLREALEALKVSLVALEVKVSVIETFHQTNTRTWNFLASFLSHSYTKRAGLILLGSAIAKFVGVHDAIELLQKLAQ